MKTVDAALNHGKKPGAVRAPKIPEDPQVFEPDPPDAARIKAETRLRGEEFLNRGWLLQQQMETMFQQVAVLDSLAKRITTCIQGEFVARSRNVTSGEDTIIRLIEAREALVGKANELLDARMEIAGMIARVKNDKQRMMLEKRYLCDMKLEEIGEDMNWDVSWVRRMLRRGEEAVGRLLPGSDYEIESNCSVPQAKRLNRYD